jgi:hypothetical protein
VSDAWDGIPEDRNTSSADTKVLNSIILYISLPAITLLYLHDFRFSAEIVLPVIMPWIYFGIFNLIFTRLGKHFRWDRKTTGVMILLGDWEHIVCVFTDDRSFLGWGEYDWFDD